MYEVIVVGAGHAGIEAALAASRKGLKTKLITINKENIADMACNPSLGGSAKGIVMKELAALGGEMPKVADLSILQIKMLNKSRGPAVQSLRAQIDKIKYQKEMKARLEETKKIEIEEGIVEKLIVEKKTVKGVVLESGIKIFANAIILTTGTYLKSDILVGSTRKEEGPHKEKRSNHLSDDLKHLGFEIIRLKTGTPPRIKKETVNFEGLQKESGDPEKHSFSLTESSYDINKQISCYLTYTNTKTHEIIESNISKSSMYGGIKNIESTGARYCPSIEDKIMRFRDKERHQIFLEPESLSYDDLYIQGLSTSMPHDIQEKMLRSIKGLEKAEIVTYAYAIEYDAINPNQLKQSLETKLIENLYTAGQINGTSGYEEAACQGLIAGINASKKIKGEPPLILRRDEAYIGVLIDDLITKGVTDPYRLLTSRAEHRLLLRNDNAAERLIKYGKENNLIEETLYLNHQKLIKTKKEIIKQLKENHVTPTDKSKNTFEKENIRIPNTKTSLYDLLKIQTINIDILVRLNLIKKIPKELIKSIETEIKYEGYLKKAMEEVEKLSKLENKRIPYNLDYFKIKNLASEAKEKLTKIKPISIGQASRISGVNPNDIMLIAIHLKKGER